MMEPKPCPFCGNKPSLEDINVGEPCVRCPKCDDPIIWGSTPDKAIEKWNTRYTDQQADDTHNALSHLVCVVGEVMAVLSDRSWYSRDGADLELRLRESLATARRVLEVSQ